MEIKHMNTSIVLYTATNGKSVELQVTDGETLWATQAQIGELFGVNRTSITKHINNILDDKELDERCVKKAGAAYHYNLDMIIAVGYRVNSKRATAFRQWATQQLKSIMTQGYAIQSSVNNPERLMSDATQAAMDTYTQRGREVAWAAARVTGVIDRKAFTDALRDVVVNPDQYLYPAATNTVYQVLWNRNAAQLKADVGDVKNLRDNLSRPMLNLLALAESTCAEHLGERQHVTQAEAIAIIRQVATIANETYQRLNGLRGRDMLTGKPLLDKRNA